LDNDEIFYYSQAQLSAWMIVDIIIVQYLKQLIEDYDMISYLVIENIIAELNLIKLRVQNAIKNTTVSQ
jgi:hypothetical protein